MPTKKKRVSVTLEEKDYSLVKKVADANGTSMSDLLRDYVEMSLPMLEHLATLIDAAKAAEAERREVHQEAVGRAMATSQSFLDAAMGQQVLFQDMLQVLTAEYSGEGTTLAELGAGDDEHQGGEGGPPYSNTGVRSVNPAKSGSAKGGL